MEAVHEGNPAHVKHYFDDYTIDADSKVSMNSDEAISHMVASLLMEDNTKPAKMFVEKLGLGDRVMDIETKLLHDANPKKQINGKTAFRLYDTFGFPLEFTKEMAQEQGFDVDEEGFKEWVDKARDMGKGETAEYIEKAIEYMQKANEMLTEAKKHM